MMLANLSRAAFFVATAATSDEFCVIVWAQKAGGRYYGYEPRGDKLMGTSLKTISSPQISVTSSVRRAV